MKKLAINKGEPILKEKFKEKWPVISEEDIKSVEELMKKGEICKICLSCKFRNKFPSFSIFWNKLRTWR